MDTIVEAIRLVAESGMKSDRALLEVIQAIVDRVNSLQQQVDLLTEVLLTKREKN